jgi:hypothetical protein
MPFCKSGSIAVELKLHVCHSIHHKKTKQRQDGLCVCHKIDSELAAAAFIRLDSTTEVFIMMSRSNMPHV